MMRCRKCKGILHHIATDMTGDNFYQCHTGLTTFGMDGAKSSHIIPCDTVYKHNGVEFHGIIAIYENSRWNKAHTEILQDIKTIKID